jgi:hypothetical protein
MELPAPYLLAGVFLAGVLVGYVIRALISARRRAESPPSVNDLNDEPLRDFPVALAMG